MSFCGRNRPKEGTDSLRCAALTLRIYRPFLECADLTITEPAALPASLRRLIISGFARHVAMLLCHLSMARTVSIADLLGAYANLAPDESSFFRPMLPRDYSSLAFFSSEVHAKLFVIGTSLQQTMASITSQQGYIGPTLL